MLTGGDWRALQCPFCDGTTSRDAVPRVRIVPAPVLLFDHVLQPGGDYAYHALGIDINVGFPVAGDVMDIDQAIVVILARHYVLVDGVWFAESDRTVRSAHREIRKYLASLESVVIV